MLRALRLLEVVNPGLGADTEDGDVAQVRLWVAAQLNEAGPAPDQKLLIRVCEVLLGTICDAPAWVDVLLAAGNKVEGVLGGADEVCERLSELWCESQLQQRFAARTKEAAEALLLRQAEQAQQAREEQQA